MSPRCLRCLLALAIALACAGCPLFEPDTEGCEGDPACGGGAGSDADADE